MLCYGFNYDGDDDRGVYMNDIRQTLTYNHANFSGGESKLTIGIEKFWSDHGYDGSYKLLNDETATVKILDDGSEVADLIVYHDGCGWYCYDRGIARLAENPIVAALQVIHNSY